MRVKIVDMGFGFKVEPLPFRNEQERRQHDIERQKQERHLCEMYDLDYDEVLRKRGEECLLEPEAV